MAITLTLLLFRLISFTAWDQDGNMSTVSQVLVSKAVSIVGSTLRNKTVSADSMKWRGDTACNSINN